MLCIFTAQSPFSFTQGKVSASSRWSTSQKHLPLHLPPLRILLPLASLHYPRTSPHCSSSSSSMSSSRSSRTCSVRVTTTWVILLCYSMGLRPMAPLSANLTGGRTLRFVGKKWRRFSKYCPATLFDPRTALGPLRWSW